jgi:hypothetical protein
MIVDGDGDGDMVQNGEGMKAVQRGKRDEQTKRVRFEDMMDNSG